MSLLDTCRCGWRSKSRNPSISSRAVVIHMRKCSLREGKAAETRNLPKRGISDMDMDGMGGPVVEPPKKVPRLPVVSGCNRNICRV